MSVGWQVTEVARENEQLTSPDAGCLIASGDIADVLPDLVKIAPLRD